MLTQQGNCYSFGQGSCVSSAWYGVLPPEVAMSSYMVLGGIPVLLFTSEAAVLEVPCFVGADSPWVGISGGQWGAKGYTSKCF